MSTRIAIDRRWYTAVNEFVNRDGELYRLQLQAGVISQEQHRENLFNEFGCRYAGDCLEFDDERLAALYLLRWS